jgi:hypothetical protein
MRSPQPRPRASALDTLDRIQAGSPYAKPLPQAVLYEPRSVLACAGAPDELLAPRGAFGTGSACMA